MKIKDRRKKLTDILRRNSPLAIAFSGGLDSTFLAKFAASIRIPVTLVHVSSPFTKKKDSIEAAGWARENKINFIEINADPMKIPKIRANPADRCYHCKKAIFGKILSCIRKKGVKHLADGTNTDDFGDFRPGMRASDELGVLHPLAEAGMGKKDIRILSRKLGIARWDRPADACLATRIPCGTPLDRKVLQKIESAENLLRDTGIRSSRVRVFGDLAVIETGPEDFKIVLKNRMRIAGALRKIGFGRILLDIEGYRTGSMNLKT